MTNRWVILRHTVSKDNLDGLHFDLLVEAGDFCRTWRLPIIPCVNGPCVPALLQPSHNLYWLERDEACVSGGRGWAKKVLGGNFTGLTSSVENDDLSIDINSSKLSGRLEIKNGLCKIVSFS